MLEESYLHHIGHFYLFCSCWACFSLLEASLSSCQAWLSKTALSSPWCCSTTEAHISEMDECTKPPSGLDVYMAWPLACKLVFMMFFQQWVIHNSVTCCRRTCISVLHFSSWVKRWYANLDYSRQIKNNVLSFATVNFDHNGSFEYNNTVKEERGKKSTKPPSGIEPETVH